MGVIESLSAGYRFLGRRLELLLIPVALDILLWAGPRLSVAPLADRLASFYTQTAAMEGVPSDVAAMTTQVSDVLTQAGRQSNLLEMLVNGSLLHVPSLLTTIGPIGAGRVFEIDNGFAAAGLAAAFSLVGLLLGVVYMSLLARRLPLGEATKSAGAAEFAQTALRQWLLVLLFVIVVALLMLVGAVPVMLGTALLTLLSASLGTLLVFLFSGTVMVLFFYLYFVVAALILDNLPLHRAVAQSFALVRKNFWATMGFIILTTLITVGMALILRSLTEFAPVGIAAAIGVNAYIGSGLAMALLVFYRTRVLQAATAEATH